ncbi:MAG: hypothetical protein R3A79_02535 [Nannocystaceae bacterium]
MPRCIELPIDAALLPASRCSRRRAAPGVALPFDATLPAVHVWLLPILVYGDYDPWRGVWGSTGLSTTSSTSTSTRLGNR